MKNINVNVSHCSKISPAYGLWDDVEASVESGPGAYELTDSVLIVHRRSESPNGSLFSRRSFCR